MARHRTYSRREWLSGTAISLAGFGLAGSWVPAARAASPPPATNPTASLKLAWTDRIAWGRVLDVTQVDGDTWEAKLEQAQLQLAGQGGGVVYFPPGEYVFRQSITIRNGIVLRGADPDEPNMLDDGYAPPSRLVFPKYEPTFSGSGQPIDTAFKGIYLADPAGDSNCGVVHLSINRAHIHLNEAEGHRSGANRLVFGCLMTNAAVADPKIPDASIGQHAWQRFTKWHFAAIHVMSSENVLIAHNRLAPSSDSFTVPGYVMKSHSIHRGTNERGPVEYDVVFDYDNRPGITVNDYCVGAPGGEEPSGTPESHPWGFRRGAVIHGNYIYCTGRTAIAFTGDGTVCSSNVIRFPQDVWRQTNTGLNETHGGSTNDNRAVQMRGYRWRVEDNDYEVYRNWAADHKYYINDGEGLMHENHCNSAIVDSVLRGNRGNAYLSLYKTGLIDGLLVEDNEIRVPPQEDKKQPGINRAIAIFVESDHDFRRDNRGPCRNVKIVNNRTVGGILLGGEPSQGNRIKGNHNLQGTAQIRKQVAQVQLEDNRGYEVVLPETS